jgi:hypothetical protein
MVVSALCFAAFGIAAPAATAAQPCWKQLVSDYWTDNRVDKVYPIWCYREAMEHLQAVPDVQQYSDAEDDLRRALLLAIRDSRGNGQFQYAEGEENTVAPVPADDEGGGKGGFITEVLSKLGPKNADSVPVPLLVLAAIAFLLCSAAGVSYAARWYQARRVTLAPPEPRP